MPEIFDVHDLDEKQDEKPSSPAGSIFTVEDAGTWSMKFDKVATDHLDQLKKFMPKATSREDVVYAALKILALAVNRNVLIKGKRDGTAKQVEGLWD